jgi:hypothetical protein
VELGLGRVGIGTKALAQVGSSNQLQAGQRGCRLVTHQPGCGQGPLVGSWLIGRPGSAVLDCALCCCSTTSGHPAILSRGLWGICRPFVESRRLWALFLALVAGHVAEVVILGRLWQPVTAVCGTSESLLQPECFLTLMSTVQLVQLPCRGMVLPPRVLATRQEVLISHAHVMPLDHTLSVRLSVQHK